VGMPKSLQGLTDLNVSVALLDGLLVSNIEMIKRNDSEYGAEESWSKLFDVRIGQSERVIGLTKSGEVLLQKRKGQRFNTKNSVNRRVSTVTVTVDTRPFGSVCLWPRGQMGRRNIWPRV